MPSFIQRHGTPQPTQLVIPWAVLNLLYKNKKLEQFFFSALFLAFTFTQHLASEMGGCWISILVKHIFNCKAWEFHTSSLIPHQNCCPTAGLKPFKLHGMFKQSHHHRLKVMSYETEGHSYSSCKLSHSNLVFPKLWSFHMERHSAVAWRGTKNTPKFFLLNPDSL